MIYKDLAGQTINVGDIVCYTALWDRSAILRYGRVKSLKSRVEWHADPAAAQKSIPTIGVVGVDRNCKSHRNPHTFECVSWEEWEILKKGHEITLGFLDRLLVVNHDQVPVKVLEILLPKEFPADTFV